jgi:hypothetical protein
VQQVSFPVLQFNRDTIFSQRNSGTNNQWTGKHHDQLSVLRQNQQKGGCGERAICQMKMAGVDYVSCGGLPRQVE